MCTPSRATPTPTNYTTFTSDKMSIHRAGREVSAIYHGSRAIKEVYHGSRKVWSGLDTFFDDFERTSVGTDWLTYDGAAGIFGEAPNRYVRRSDTSAGQSNLWTRRMFEYQNTEVEVTIPGGHDRAQATSIIIGERDVRYYYIEFTNNRYVLGEYDGVRWTTLRDIGSRTFNAGDRVGIKYVNGALSTWHNGASFSGSLPSFTLPATYRRVGLTFRADRVFIASFYSPGVDEITVKAYN